MEQIVKRIEALEASLNESRPSVGYEKLSSELEGLRHKMSQPNFWQDSQNAQALSKREAEISRRIKPWQLISDGLRETKELAALKDEKMAAELDGQLNMIEAKLEELKADLKYSGPYDDHEAIVSIYAGAGGTDAQDWAQMLLRMYIRWAEKKGFKVVTIDQSAGEEAGIKSATIKITGNDFLYGKLAGEHGVHRLVRLSPFNADHLRQTSFAKVEVLPLIERSEEVEVDEKDLKIDVFRAGGHGGQSVNTTDSAVRVTHAPTGISVSIQNERSQLQNKETALSVLKSRLLALQIEQHAKTISELKGPKQSAEWGNQIRSYVLHPYKQVKDNRSGFESSNVDKILNGDLDSLIAKRLA